MPAVGVTPKIFSSALTEATWCAVEHTPQMRGRHRHLFGGRADHEVAEAAQLHCLELGAEELAAFLLHHHAGVTFYAAERENERGHQSTLSLLRTRRPPPA